MASIGQDLLDVPFAAMVRSMAGGIAEAQFTLDMVSLRIAQLMTGKKQKSDQSGKPDGFEDDPGAKISFGNETLTLLELGFTPTFYQFVDTIIEVKMSISMSSSEEETESKQEAETKTSFEGSMGWFKMSGSSNVKASSVNASFASKYQYSAEGASLLRTKLVPVPPPAILAERIRRLIAAPVAATTPPPPPNS